MRTLVLQGGERHLAFRDGALVVEVKGEVVHRLGSEEVEEIHVFGDAQLSPAARSAVLRLGIPLHLFAPQGSYRGSLLGPLTRAGERRLAQVRVVLDPGRRLKLAQQIVAGKLRNQLIPLQRAHRGTPSEVLVDAIVGVKAALDRVSGAADLDVLRGVEGLGARAYFSGMGVMVRHPDFRFEGRRRRPPTDPVNAALSFLYTLLCTRTTMAAQEAGLDPYVGLLHEAGRGKPALALDLAEEWRPLVDSVVLRIFNQGQVQPDDFIRPGTAPGVELPPDPEEEPGAPTENAVWLGEVARTIVLHAWDRRLRDRSESPNLDGSWALRDVLRHQARHLGACFEDPALDYTPFAWR